MAEGQTIRRAGRSAAIVAAVTGACAVACATDAPDVQVEIERLDRAAAEGVSTVRRALGDPSLQFQDLGVGVETVEVAARALRGLGEDDRLSPSQRVSATLAEARAFDDLAITFETTKGARLFGLVGSSAPAPSSGLADATDVLEDILSEKALPARLAARDAYVRARTLACRTNLAEPAVMLEILDGVSRYVGEDAVTEPCPE